MSVLVGGGGPQVNKLEQVSIDGHQMSLAVVGLGVPCLMSGGGPGSGGGRTGLYSEVQCIMDNGHIVTPCEQNGGQTRLKTLPSRNFVGAR